jgi:hypothetical protein
MASTRNYNILGVWAKAAQTTIPADPISGTVYRDPAVDVTEFEEGWPYDQLVNSADFNQKLFLVTSVLEELDKQGILGWSDLVDYDAVPALVRGSDGLFYKSIQTSGPNDPNGVQDPVLDVGNVYWEEFSSGAGGTMAEQVYADGVDYTAGDGLQLDLVLPADPGGDIANVWVSFDGIDQFDGFVLTGGTGIRFPVGIPSGVGQVRIKVGSTIITTTTTYVQLSDTPSSFAGDAYKAVRVSGASNGLVHGGTGALLIDSGTTAQRPASPINGMIRHNTDLNKIESYENGAWGKIGKLPEFHIQDQRPTGTHGGNSILGDNIRDLNSIILNEITGASLLANQIILPEGEYEIFASVPASSDGNLASMDHQAFLYNVSDAVEEIIGSSEFVNSTTDVGLTTRSLITGRFSVPAGGKTFEIRHYTNLAIATFGLGLSSLSGRQEVYTDVIIKKF